MKICVVADHDPIWGTFAWRRTLPYLKKSHDVAGFWQTTPKTRKPSQQGSLIWHLLSFTLSQTVILTFFYALVASGNVIGKILFNRPLSMKSICGNLNIPFYETNSINDNVFKDWVEANQIDVVVIMINRIIDRALLKASSAIFLNKHSSLLPAARGVYPYIWNRISDAPQGVSFHIVTQEIDDGEVIFQEVIDQNLGSMLAFYVSIFGSYDSFLARTIKNLEQHERTVLNPALAASYNTFPTRCDMRAFRATGGRIAKWRDLRLVSKIIWDRPS